MTPTAYDALHAALVALCTDDPLAARLARAHDALLRLDPERDLPDDLRFRYEELVADIAYGADNVTDALQRMSAPDRERLATRIVALFDRAVRGLPVE